MSRPQSTRTSLLVSISMVSLVVGLMSSRLDGFALYILSGGSIVLALLITCAVLDMIFTGLAWMCERQLKSRLVPPAISYSSFPTRVAGAILEKSQS